MEREEQKCFFTNARQALGFIGLALTIFLFVMVVKENTPPIKEAAMVGVVVAAIILLISALRLMEEALDAQHEGSSGVPAKAAEGWLEDVIPPCAPHASMGIFNRRE